MEVERSLDPITCVMGVVKGCRTPAQSHDCAECGQAMRAGVVKAPMEETAASAAALGASYTVMGI